MENTKMYFLVALMLMLCAVQGRINGDICSPNSLAVYRIKMETHWSKEAFPKQYPAYRPPAQFSRLLGMVHNSSYVLWREGNTASPEVRLIAESGSGELLEQMKGVRDVFAAPKVAQGVGSTESVLYSDAKHTKISVISKIIPSPDWFVGLDSYELCLNGFWLNNITVEGGPIDAGTDNGFTFTAPNWSTDPQAPITRLTAQEPSHPANSFYYPDLKYLPPLVTFRITKERVYRAKARKLLKHRRKINKTNTIVVSLPDATQPDVSTNLVEHTINRSPHLKRIRKKNTRKLVNCVMSQWSSWSPCSASCGVGTQVRNRKMLVRPRRGGSTCPAEVQQTSWCGEHTRCIDNYFNW